MRRLPWNLHAESHSANLGSIPDNFIDHVATVIDIRQLFFTVSSNSQTS